ncbi:MAG TPA: hypothetical protein VF669_21370 [Tepidisphaeraceae bacterium]|jgi:hypothetical protein
MKQSIKRALGAAAALALSTSVYGQDKSPPVILQWFESSWKTMQKRTPDVFMAGYGAIWTPPPGRALYDDQGGGIGYNLYDRFDMGKAGDPTLYGTEKQYRALINGVHKMNGDVYVDYVHHHVGSWDVPQYTGANGFTPDAFAKIQDRSDYPGFELSDPYVASNSYDPNYRNYTGFANTQRDTYSDPPPVPDGNSTQYQYMYRLAHLITIDLTSGRTFVRNPVPGDPNNIRQAPSGWAIGTSTMVNGKPGPSSIVRQANTPTDDNRRFYPDQSLTPMMVTDPATGVTTPIPIYPFNKNNPSAGDPTAETNAGYVMRYAQWLVNDIGVDGLRIDAARHVPYGAANDPYNPDRVNVPALIDRATYRQSTRTNLDGTARQVFNFQEVFTGDKGFNQQFVRKDINPGTPSVVGGNRDVLDFPGWFAMRGNLTRNGLHNNWYNIRYSSQDSQDDGIANNGSQSIRFVINHDDGKGNADDKDNDYIYLDNVAHAWTLMQPGNAYVYFNSHEFDRTGNTTYFLKDGRNDALGGQNGAIITKLLDIRNSYGRGNFGEKWIDGGGFSNVYAFERDKSVLVGLNSALGTVTNFDERTMFTGFANGQHLAELTGNADDPQVDPSNQIPNTVTVGANGQVTIRIPRNQNVNGLEHGRGYVIYGLQRPQGAVSVTNVAKTLAAETGSNATSRVNQIDVITANSFNITLLTSAVTLGDGYRDYAADGDKAYVRIDGGMDLNGDGHDHIASVDAVKTYFGFENFHTINDPGYDANPSFSGNGTYVQSVNAANLSEGYHYITARAYRQRSDGGPDIFNDIKKVIYVDRLPPQSAISGITQSGSGSGRTLGVQVTSTDQTADNVHVLMDLGSALTDAQILSMLNSGSLTDQLDLDIFSKSVAGVTNGTHTMTVVTREITGNYSIVRATGLGTSGGNGLGFGDTNASGTIDTTDIAQFKTVLESNDQQFNAGAEANTDGRVNLADTFLLGPRLSQVGASNATVSAYNNMIKSSATVLNGTYTVDANHTVHDVTAGSTHVLGSTKLTARSIQRGNLQIDSTAAVAVQTKANGGGGVHLSTLSITPGGKLDLNDNNLIVDNGDFQTISALRWEGYRDSTDTAATGIISTVGQTLLGHPILALFDNSIAGFGDWPFGAGNTVSSAAVLGQFAYLGDADLNGMVTPDDYGAIDSNLGTHVGTAEESGGMNWFAGDWNLDGDITPDDYGAVDANLGLGQYNPLAATGLAAQGVAAVPEPAALTLIAATAGALVARRRR